MLPQTTKSLSTPSKSTLAESHGIQPVTPASFRQNEVGKKIYSLASTLRSKIIEWDKYIAKGLPLCKNICAMNLHDLDEPTAELHAIMENLVSIISKLETIVEDLKTIANQSKALQQLPCTDPVMQTWNVAKFSLELNIIIDSYIDELKYKKMVTDIFTEWIGHGPSAAITRTYKVLWEVDMKIDRVKPTLMFWEVGMTPTSETTE